MSMSPSHPQKMDGPILKKNSRISCFFSSALSTFVWDHFFPWSTPEDLESLHVRSRLTPCIPLLCLVWTPYSRVQCPNGQSHNCEANGCGDAPFRQAGEGESPPKLRENGWENGETWRTSETCWKLKENPKLSESWCIVSSSTQLVEVPEEMDKWGKLPNNIEEFTKSSLSYTVTSPAQNTGSRIPQLISIIHN